MVMKYKKFVTTVNFQTNSKMNVFRVEYEQRARFKKSYKIVVSIPKMVNK